MNRLLLSLLTYLLFTSVLWAGQRDIAEAERIASQFFSSTSTFSGRQQIKQADLPMQLLMKKADENQQEKDLYYVFGVKDAPGFVIVSGDERSADVLAYSETNSFDPDNIPINMQEWLRFYEAELSALEENGTARPGYYQTPAKAEAPSQFAPSIEPLLGNIKWNQYAPYNNYSPIIPATNERAVTGCVATAMAMVMKYHEWPVQGKGSRSYTTDTHKINLSSNFSQVTFDWANMTDTYNNNSSSAANEAVAVLMYNCGVSVSMDFADVSGARSENIAPALVNYFSYDKNAQFWKRDYYTRDEWIEIIKIELNENRPVIYAGHAPDGGHQFVCDGYDNNGFFHFNWGWGGLSDGYFRISSLAPSDQGAGSSIGGYNSYQSIITGVQKPTAGSTIVTQFHMGDTIIYPHGEFIKTGVINVEVKAAYNYGANDLNNSFLALGVYDNNDNLVKRLHTYKLEANLPPGWGYSSLPFSLGGKFDGIEPGSYRVFPIFTSDNDPEWTKMRGYVGRPAHLNLTVTETTVQFSTSNNQLPVLELQELKSTGNIYATKSARIAMTVKNSGQEFNALLGLVMQKADNPLVTDTIHLQNVNIAAGETREFEVSSRVNLNPGEYLLKAVYNPANHPYSKLVETLGDPVTVQVKMLPAGDPALLLTKTVQLRGSGPVYIGQKAVLDATISNSGAPFDNKVISFIFNEAGGSSLTYIGYQDYFIDQGETVDVEFGGSIDLDPGRYMMATFFEGPNGWAQMEPKNMSKILFDLSFAPTGVGHVKVDNDIHVYPNPVITHLNIESKNSIKDVEVFDFSGKLVKAQRSPDSNHLSIDVSSMPAGNYLLKVVTTEGMAVQHFIKQD